MSKKNKLQKFAELLSFPNVYENFEAKNPVLTGMNGLPVERKGQWTKEHFGNDNPLILELACGRGEYAVGMGRLFSNRNFIGIDIKGARIWKGAGIALKAELHNVAFLRTRIELITHFFAPEEVSEIWITFPDPFLKKGKSNRRLTAPRFLDEYKKILKKDGIIHLKTDSPHLYEFTLEVLAEYKGVEIIHQDADIYSKPLPIPELDIKTYYEELHISGDDTIKYVSFRLT